MSSATTPAGKPPPTTRHGAEETLPSITISTSVEIDAPKQLVWDVLTDFSAYREWNPYMENATPVLVALAKPFLNKEKNQAGYEGFNHDPRS
jgi:uncharacterized membrane protein